MNPEALYLQLGQLKAEMPDLSAVPPTGDTVRWIARVIALLEASGDLGGAVEVKVASGQLTSVRGGYHAQKIALALEIALAKAEIAAPVHLHGAFIPAGSTFDGFMAVGKALIPAKVDILFLDPYADARLLEFASLATEGVPVRVLSDAADYKETLKPAADRWIEQFGAKRPLEVRLAASKALHDRYILIDGGTVFSVGQSFKDLATRARTALVRLDPETAARKIEVYKTMWQAATAIAR